MAQAPSKSFCFLIVKIWQRDMRWLTRTSDKSKRIAAVFMYINNDNMSFVGESTHDISAFSWLEKIFKATDIPNGDEELVPFFCELDMITCLFLQGNFDIH